MTITKETVASPAGETERIIEMARKELVRYRQELWARLMHEAKEIAAGGLSSLSNATAEAKVTYHNDLFHQMLVKVLTDLHAQRTTIDPIVIQNCHVVNGVVLEQWSQENSAEGCVIVNDESFTNPKCDNITFKVE